MWERAIERVRVNKYERQQEFHELIEVQSYMQMKKIKNSNTNKPAKRNTEWKIRNIFNIQIRLHALQSWVTKPNEKIWYFLYIFYIQLHWSAITTVGLFNETIKLSKRCTHIILSASETKESFPLTSPFIVNEIILVKQVYTYHSLSNSFNNQLLWCVAVSSCPIQ